MQQTLHTVVKTLISCIAPARCISCLVEGTWHCTSCQSQFRPASLACIVCKKFQVRGLTCTECKDETVLMGVVTAGSYRNPALRRGIHWLKFKHIRPVAKTLSWLVVPQITKIAPIEHLQTSAALIPIPLYKRRQKQRGFNQSELIAHHIAGLISIPMIDALVRQRSTWSQANLSQELRERNVAHAFTIKKEPDIAHMLKRFHTIILVDDVTTSGSTLNAAAEELKALSDASIWGLTIARG